MRFHEKVCGFGVSSWLAVYHLSNRSFAHIPDPFQRSHDMSPTVSHTTLGFGFTCWTSLNPSTGDEGCGRFLAVQFIVHNRVFSSLVCLSIAAFASAFLVASCLKVNRK